MKQSGATIVFKEGITPEQAAIALESIAHLIEMPKPDRRWLPKERLNQSPARLLVNEFEPEYGSPCWYIP